MTKMKIMVSWTIIYDLLNKFHCKTLTLYCIMIMFKTEDNYVICTVRKTITCIVITSWCLSLHNGVGVGICKERRFDGH